MKITEKKWIDDYIESRREILRIRPDLSIEKQTIGNSLEYIYQLLKPTGIIYGFPVKMLELTENLVLENDALKTKIILLEGFIRTYEIHCLQNSKILTEKTTEEAVIKTGVFYGEIFPDLKEKSKGFFSGKEKEGLELSEFMIENHIDIKKSWDNFWNSFFDNSVLFLDLVYFHRWLAGGDLEQMKDHRQDFLIQVLEIIIATANVDGSWQNEEKKIFQSFLHSAKLPEEKVNYLESIAHMNVDPEDLHLSRADNKVLIKYIYEIAVMTAGSNKEFDENEEKFLDDLAKILHLDEQESQESLMAVEGFILQHWESVHFLQTKHSFHLVKEQFKKTASKVLSTNKEKISQEVRESKELMQLMTKSATQKLSDEEKAKVKSQLLDILKTIPTIAIFILPLGSLILPLLLKVLPQSVIYPTAFYDKD